MKRAAVLLALAGLMAPGSALARDRLGVWNDWGAFRDAAVPRCYAIAMAQPVTAIIRRPIRSLMRPTRMLNTTATNPPGMISMVV